jgi:hypothetical protein
MSFKKVKVSKKKPENIKDQIIMTLIMTAANLGAANKGQITEKFLEDAMTALDTMNMDYLMRTLLPKFCNGVYGKQYTKEKNS